MKIVVVFLVGNYSLCQLCKSELAGNRGSKEGNAEAQSTQPWFPHLLEVSCKIARMFPHLLEVPCKIARMFHTIKLRIRNAWVEGS